MSPGLQGGLFSALGAFIGGAATFTAVAGITSQNRASGFNAEAAVIAGAAGAVAGAAIGGAVAASKAAQLGA